MVSYFKRWQGEKLLLMTEGRGKKMNNDNTNNNNITIIII